MAICAMFTMCMPIMAKENEENITVLTDDVTGMISYVKTVGNDYYYSDDGINYQLFASIGEAVEKPKNEIGLYSIGTWQGPTILGNNFTIYPSSTSADAIMVVLQGCLVYATKDVLLLETLAEDIYYFALDLMGAQTFYTDEEYYSYSKCSIYIKIGEVSIYEKSSKTPSSFVTSYTSNKKYFLDDPKSYTSPVGCRYLTDEDLAA